MLDALRGLYEAVEFKREAPCGLETEGLRRRAG